MSESEFYIDTDGIVRWNSNNNIPFDDMLGKFYYEGRITLTQKVMSGMLREIEVSKTLDAYREQMKNHAPDAEELFEMRAAFGEGATVVNVITGKKVKL